MAADKTRVAVVREKMRWGSREVDRREISGDWPQEIERHGIRYVPAGPDRDMPLRIERCYYEVIEHDD